MMAELKEAKPGWREAGLFPGYPSIDQQTASFVEIPKHSVSFQEQPPDVPIVPVIPDPIFPAPESSSSSSGGGDLP